MCRINNASSTEMYSCDVISLGPEFSVTKFIGDLKY